VWCIGTKSATIDGMVRFMNYRERPPKLSHHAKVTANPAIGYSGRSSNKPRKI
jgi:hypothetical protein